MFCHAIKANKGNSRPSRIIFFDVETSQRKLPNGDIAQDFRYGEALYWRMGELGRKETLEAYSITTPSDFWEWVISKRHGKCLVYLVSHNLNIDLVALGAFQELPDRGFSLRSLYIKGMTKIISFRSDSMTLKCLDNANWWKSSLAELGELVGFPKLEVNPVGVSLEELIPYCKRDVEIIYRIWREWLAFLDEHQLGNWGITIGSQAFKSYTHRFMPHTIYVHNNSQAVELERLSYHGGRVEPFWLGKWKDMVIHKLDVNSMYPFVMRENPHPVKLLTVKRQETILGLARNLKSYLAIAEVEIATPEPVFPYQGKEGAFYPVGRFRAYLCTPELLYALERGYIQRVNQVAYYQGERIFTQYVDFFYNLKAKYSGSGNGVYRNAVKLMLNCLYGKFGQKGLEGKVLGSCHPDLVKVEPYIHAQTGERGYTLYLAGSIIQVKERELSYNSFVAISAHCTAYARMYLWRLINEAGKSNCLYCDTDSLLLTDAGRSGLSDMLDISRLGLLKHEGTFQEGEIRGKKDYRLGSHITLKGIPKKAIPLGELSFGFDLWPSIRLLLREGDVSQYYIRPTTRTLKRKLNWGVLRKDGFIEPFYLQPVPIPTEENQERIWKLQLEIASLKEARTLPHRVVFKYWDYRQGTFRKGVEDLTYNSRPWGVGPDSKASELGFHEYSDFLAAIEAQVKIDYQIRSKSRELSHLLSG